MARRVRLALFLLLPLLLSGCLVSYHQETPTVGPPLERVTEFEDVPTGIVSTGDRLFVCFPHWWREPAMSVAEILPDGSRRPFPNKKWNAWDGCEESAGLRFVCVQSLTLDRKGRLWILDAGNPGLRSGVVPGGAKLVVVDLKTDRVVRILRFPPSVAPEDSYLNDVRIAPDGRTAYLADSDLGALVVLNLETGRVRRLMENHPSILAEPCVVPEVGGHPFRTLFWMRVVIHVDGIALTPDGKYLYYHPLIGRTLYRIPTKALRNPDLSEEDLGRQVETLEQTSACDGIETDAEGNLYITAIEHDAIEQRRPDGTWKMVVQDPRIRWPDAIAVDGKHLYFTCSKIHLEWPFNWGFSARETPYAVFRIPAP